MAAPETYIISGAAAFSPPVIFGLTTIKGVALPQRDSGFANSFSLQRALFQAQGEAVGEHGDELGICRFALDI